MATDGLSMTIHGPHLGRNPQTKTPNIDRLAARGVTFTHAYSPVPACEPTRAPLIWVAPGVTRPGGVSTRTVDFMSIYPTLCELAAVPLPGHVEGSSIVSLLRDPAAPWDRPGISTHGYKNHAVRTEQWRLIRYADGSEEFYDETKDPYEWTNLAKNPEYTAARATLAAMLPTRDAPHKGGGSADTTDEDTPRKGKARKAKKE